MSKGERTKALILNTALELFRKEGYEQTTMRDIAAAAGLSVGNAYYYFRGKDELIQSFYERNHADHLELLGDRLEQTDDFAERLALLVRTKIDVSMPYRRLATRLFTTAADPQSQLSPFSAESAPLRGETIALLDKVVADSSLKVPKMLRPDLPELLWFYEMAVILYWVHDTSKDCFKTYALIERTVPLVEKLIGLARLPVARPVLREALSLLNLVRGES